MNNIHMHEFIHNVFLTKYDDPCIHEILTHVLHNRACQHVWAIILEQDNLPVFVIRNAAFTDRKLSFRRILVVNCDDIEITNTTPVLGYFLLLNLIAFISIVVSFLRHVLVSEYKTSA